jgi:hypothetical protein
MALGYCELYDGSVSSNQNLSHLPKYIINLSPSHPNIIQLHAAASSNRIHATVFHDGTPMDLKCVTTDLTLEIDLIPFEQFLDRYSPLLKVYIYGYCVRAAATSHLLNIDISEEYRF